MLRRTFVYKIGAAVALLLMGVSFVLAESAPQPAQDALLKNGPPIWDTNHDGVFTCDEWKSFVDRIFTSADRNHDGNLSPSEFETVRKADATLADADFGYFDENQDGKITRKEFVEKPNVFISRFDRNGDCRVTADEIKAAVTPKGPQGPPERPRSGRSDPPNIKIIYFHCLNAYPAQKWGPWRCSFSLSISPFWVSKARTGCLRVWVDRCFHFIRLENSRSGLRAAIRPHVNRDRPISK